MLPIVCWAAKPTIAASTAVEARMPVASRFNSVNWASAIAMRTRKTTRISSRRRKRRRVLVDRETCETAGVMDATVSAKRVFPYANWGPVAAVLGVLLAIGAGIMLSVPVVIAAKPPSGEELGDAASALVQFATAVGFLLVPFAIAARR